MYLFFFLKFCLFSYFISFLHIKLLVVTMVILIDFFLLFLQDLEKICTIHPSYCYFYLCKFVMASQRINKSKQQEHPMLPCLVSKAVSNGRKPKKKKSQARRDNEERAEEQK